jgi:hypothetical protein
MEDIHILGKISTLAHLHQKNLPIPEQTVQNYKSLLLAGTRNTWHIVYLHKERSDTLSRQ